jgi:hypothetical protein
MIMTLYQSESLTDILYAIQLLPCEELYVDDLRLMVVASECFLDDF